MKKINKTPLLAGIGVFLLALFLSTQTAFAQDTLGLSQIDNTIALSGTDIRIVIAKIIRAALGLLGTIMLGLMVYAGGIWMTSAGAEDKIAQAKKIMVNAVIGLTIILSALAIVQFVISSLLQATRSLGTSGSSRPGFETFTGSGALGSIVADHYPFRNERDVKRNTKIAVTFIEPIRPESIILNTNDSCWTAEGTSTRDNCALNADGEIADPYYGDCLPAGDGSFICDTLNTNAVRIGLTADIQNENPEWIVATAMTLYEDGDNRHAYTFVFDPVELLGSPEENRDYTVILTNNIVLASGDRAFDRTRALQYTWDFQTGTEIDLDPPHVVSVYPRENGQGYKNSIVQITFNEPMDPTVVQGATGENSPFDHIIFSKTLVEGEWRVTNGYRTVSFISNESCGLNSCGDTMYCLPSLCEEEGCLSEYEVLLRTAAPIDPASGSFEAVPFSGIMDLSSNALDTRAGTVVGGDGVLQGKPPIGERKIINQNERVPDNGIWAFNIANTIDRTPPHIQSISPDIDTGGVVGQTEVLITFNEEMWYATLRGIGIEEYPAEVGGLDLLWTSPISRIGAGNTTITEVRHRVFGPNGLDLYYFPYIPSSVKDAQQNCVYPGVGPAEVGEPCIDGDPNSAACTSVTLRAEEDTACVTKFRQDIVLQANVLDCRATLRRADISPLSE
ncbi:pilin [Patescibacteria group bacterium]|nr:pilin [Patescibacteria group bacterium]MBU1721896.1 pilin [Patescibacteria group bacterium]MBU1900872.1 pilin [Patescibacteria group bacterium]